MPPIRPQCINVQFKCACNARTCIVASQCYAVKSSSTTNTHAPYCYATQIEVANLTNVCAKCWSRPSKPDSKDPILKAIETEADKIRDAFLKVFRPVGNWGYQLKDFGISTRVIGVIHWVERLEGIVMQSQGFLPQPELGMRGNIEVPDCLEYGGQKSFRSTPQPHEGDVLGYCMKSITDKKNRIMALTTNARDALRKKGFMVNGRLIQLISAFDNKSCDESNQIPQTMLQKWKFWQWEDACAFIIVYGQNDGKSVEISRIEEKACQQGRNVCRYFPLENST